MNHTLIVVKIYRICVGLLLLKCILTTAYKMSCQDDVLRVGKKLEKMISSKNVVSAVELEYAVPFGCSTQPPVNAALRNR